MSINWALILALLIPNIGGWAGAISMSGQVKRPDGRSWYELLIKPSWNPPAWVFGPAWTLLYTMMGYASYRVYQECGGFTQAAILPLALYGVHLILNWTWSPVFFGLHLIGWAFIHMLFLDAAAVATAISFYKTNATAGLLLLPYLGWLTFATCLNYAIWTLNSGFKEV